MKNGSVVIAMRKQFDADLLSNYLKCNTALQVDYYASSLTQVSRYFREQSATLLVCDATFPRLEAVAVGEQVRTAGHVIHLMFIDERYNPPRAKMAELAQAAYCPKSEGLEKTVAIIEVLANDIDQLYTSRKVNELLNVQRRLRIDCPVYSTLTNRELEVLTYLADGFSISECAQQLSLAVSTIDNHKSRLMKKLEIRKSTGLVRLAIRSGLIEP